MTADTKRRLPQGFFSIIILVYGLLVAVWQTLLISHQVYFNEQSDFLADLCWIAVGMTIELFGISLIIFGNGK